MSKAYIFVDEFGTPDLNIQKQGVTPYFVYTAVVIEESELANARNILKSITKKYFGNTHIKSKNIGNDNKGHVKRMNILKELINIKHHVIALVIDKSKIDSQGLTYKKSFIKFFNNLLTENFIGRYEEFHIILDKIGWQNFQDELKRYMAEKGHQQNLFSNNTFELKDDITEEPLIQIADFYAGCVGKYYCGTINKNQAEAINNVLKSYLFVEWYPREFVSFFGASVFEQNDFNLQIATISKKSADDYLLNNKDEIGCEIVKLILQETAINPLRYISSKEIKKKINAKGIKIGDPILEIGKLRDKGVFIVSPIGKKGYKLPCSETEIIDFYNRLISNVAPQLKRGFILHKLLVQESFSEINILEKAKFNLLNTLMNVVENHGRENINLN